MNLAEINNTELFLNRKEVIKRRDGSQLYYRKKMNEIIENNLIIIFMDTKV